jgi:DNA helicase-2/ATP-dependent DNA helicase PcrA
VSPVTLTLICSQYFERKEVKDAVAYLRLAANPSDDVAFLRCINTPKRGVGAKAIDSTATLAKQHKVGEMHAVGWRC